MVQALVTKVPDPAALLVRRRPHRMDPVQVSARWPGIDLEKLHFGRKRFG
jgi:hypothetical protein